MSKCIIKRGLNSRITYCQTPAISQRAAKAHQGKTQRDREATNKDRGKREWGLEAEMWKERRRECRAESRDWLPLIFTISGADKRRACLCSDTNCPWKVTRGEAEALSSDRPRSATSSLITGDTRQPSRHTGHQPHQLNSRNPSRERQTERGERDREWVVEWRIETEREMEAGLGTGRIDQNRELKWRVRASCTGEKEDLTLRKTERRNRKFFVCNDEMKMWMITKRVKLIVL